MNFEVSLKAGAWCLVFLVLTSCRSPLAVVGPSRDRGIIVPTLQSLHPAGRSVEFNGRPVDLAVSPDGKTAYLKSDQSVIVLDLLGGVVRQELKYPNQAGASLHGIAISKNGAHLYVTLAQSAIAEFNCSEGKVVFVRSIPIRLKKEGQSYPCGIALSADEKTAYVCLSVDNCLAVVDLGAGKITQTIATGLAPFDVKLSAKAASEQSAAMLAYVSNWGGRRANPQDKTSPSAGTPVVVDDRGIAASGTVSVIDLASAKQTAEIATGLHPCELLVTKDGRTLYVANANSDTVSVIDTASRSVTRSIAVRPQADLPFGSAPNALAMSADERTLFIANGGNNAVAVADLTTMQVRGFIPVGWYPGSLAVDGNKLFVVNVKGLGARNPATKGKWSTRYGTWGSLNVIEIPDQLTLDKYTARVRADALVPQTLKSLEQGSHARAVPVPKHPGERSVFRHVVYVIKENRTYDQVFGDIGKGNSDPSLCIYGRTVTPNQHALAEQFALLDNYYCNGVLSPDGHQWATEGITTDFVEKSFGAWIRSYPSTGDDPLAYAPSGFIWDNALLHGLTFRNYGEFRYDVFDPFAHGGTNRAGMLRSPPNVKGSFKPHLGLAAIEPYTCPDFPGYTTDILDVQRAEIFIHELREFEKNGRLPHLMIVYLPNNHTNGTRPDSRTPNAMVADNDLAVGRIVDAISHSVYWKDTCIFVTEDDPQDGFDHVDGHRSPCLVVSAYTKRKATVSAFYSQTSVLHSIELMLGLRPMNQFDAMAPAMRKCFMNRPDLTPFSAVPNIVSLEERNPPKSALRGTDLEMAELSEGLPLDQPDCADENSLNRILWHAARPSDPYPVAYVGAHGRGLERLHLKLDGFIKDNDD